MCDCQTGQRLVMANNDPGSTTESTDCSYGMRSEIDSSAGEPILTRLRSVREGFKSPLLITLSIHQGSEWGVVSNQMLESEWVDSWTMSECVPVVGRVSETGDGSKPEK